MRQIAIVLLLSLAECSAWICGNTGQCSCSSSGFVLCKDADAAPFFAEVHRPGKKLTIKTTNDQFDMSSMTNTKGFERVIVMGLSADLCETLISTFPWARCLVNDLGSSKPRVTVTSWTRTTVSDPKDDVVAVEEPLIGTKSSLKTYGTGMIVWTILSSIFGGIMTCCILVSLVNLHARINSHARSDDPPLFAVACCLKCLALMLYPVHLIAKCCNWTCCDIHTLDRGTPPSTTPFQV